MRAGSGKLCKELLWKSPPLPPDPHHPGRLPDEAWKAAPKPAPSHPSWKTLRVSHSQTTTTTACLFTTQREEETTLKSDTHA